MYIYIIFFSGGSTYGAIIAATGPIAAGGVEVDRVNRIWDGGCGLRYIYIPPPVSSASVSASAVSSSGSVSRRGEDDGRDDDREDHGEG